MTNAAERALPFRGGEEVNKDERTIASRTRPHSRRGDFRIGCVQASLERKPRGRRCVRPGQ